jgi:hypothetical protein
MADISAVAAPHHQVYSSSKPRRGDVCPKICVRIGRYKVNPLVVTEKQCCDPEELVLRQVDRLGPIQRLMLPELELTPSRYG